MRNSTTAISYITLLFEYYLARSGSRKGQRCSARPPTRIAAQQTNCHIYKFLRGYWCHHDRMLLINNETVDAKLFPCILRGAMIRIAAHVGSRMKPAPNYSPFNRAVQRDVSYRERRSSYDVKLQQQPPCGSAGLWIWWCIVLRSCWSQSACLLQRTKNHGQRFERGSGCMQKLADTQKTKLEPIRNAKLLKFWRRPCQMSH